MLNQHIPEGQGELFEPEEDFNKPKAEKTEEMKTTPIQNGKKCEEPPSGFTKEELDELYAGESVFEDLGYKK